MAKSIFSCEKRRNERAVKTCKMTKVVFKFMITGIELTADAYHCLQCF
jgi:hypothetical protein